MTNDQSQITNHRSLITGHQIGRKKAQEAQKRTMNLPRMTQMNTDSILGFLTVGACSQAILAVAGQISGRKKAQKAQNMGPIQFYHG